MDLNYYVYRHIRLDNNTPFYIGMGTKAHDYNTHRLEYDRAYSKQNRSKLWKEVIKLSDYKVEILFETSSINVAKEKETEFIILYGKSIDGSGSLVNILDGDNSKKIYQLDYDHNLLNTFNTIIEATQFYGCGKNFIGYCVNGKSKDPKYIWTTDLNNIPVYEETENQCFKVIYQFDLDSNFIKEYPSIKIAEEENNLGRGKISRCIKGLTNTTNFLWSTDRNVIPMNVIKKVLQFNLNGNFINEFSTVKEASINSNINSATIFRILNDVNKTNSTNYFWCYDRCIIPKSKSA